MIPVFLRWLSLGIAVSVGTLCTVQHAAAMDAAMSVKTADSDDWRLAKSLYHRQGDDALIAPVLLSGESECISRASTLQLDEVQVACKKQGKHSWYWYSVEPIAKDYDNSSSCRPVERGCVQSLAYRVSELEALRGKGEVSARELEALLGLGTHWLMPSARELPLGERVIKTRGRPAAFEFVVRRDDSYVGHLTELIGVPFTYFPSLTLEGEHQTDAHLGADCVALAIYGQRRIGRKIPYMAPPALKRYSSVVIPIMNEGQPVKVGDILSFGFQTAVISQDRNKIGFLDDGDLIIHTYHGYAEEVAFAELPYKQSEFKVRRWKIE